MEKSLLPGLQLGQSRRIADAIADGRSGREHLALGTGTHLRGAGSWHTARPAWHTLGLEAGPVLHLGKVSAEAGLLIHRGPLTPLQGTALMQASVHCISASHKGKHLMIHAQVTPMRERSVHSEKVGSLHGAHFVMSPPQLLCIRKAMLASYSWLHWPWGQPPILEAPLPVVFSSFIINVASIH